MQDSTSRQMRVFISSTFRDMQAERDHLVKFIFPQLRKLCEHRGVTWSEVDLRWGITSEQSAEGQVLPICLEEIQRCKPYFIGLLGERYGWVPDEINPALIEREPWLIEHIGHSVTELEILHGVLNDPGMAGHALFYFRDPNAIPDEQKDDYLEIPGQEEIDRFGKETAWKNANSRREKLSVLKERIRKSGLPVKENFNTPQQLGEWILQDLTAVINQLYPEGSQLTAFQREMQEHEAFASSRQRVYIGGEKYFNQINDHLAHDHAPLVVVGESGLGKSALLANWGLQYRREHPDVLVLMHFIGTSAVSNDWAAMLRRILGEMQERFDIQGEIPADENTLREVFPDWLFKASQKGQVILILDALNQLEDKQGAQELTWLPLEFPKNIQVILSTLPGKALDIIKERGYPVLPVEPLEQQEREKFVSLFLAQFSKQLSLQQVSRIVENTKTSNPLALSILLDELRQFGSYERLDETIQHYLNADSIIEMLELVFERCEKDFEAERPDLVKDTLCSIWAARQGLSEAELLDMLGKENEPLAQRKWSPLHLALEESLVEHSGFLNFSHDYIRQAVEKHYLETESEKKTVHVHLADYFQSIDGYPMRRVNELPWQLQQAQEWQRLYDLLADLDYVIAQWSMDRYDLFKYWASIEENTDFNRVQAYKDIKGNFKNPDYLILLNCISLFFLSTGYLKEAMELLKEQERICRILGKKDGIQISLSSQALILKDWGKLDEAMELFKEQERICWELGNEKAIQFSLGNQAVILQKRGELEEAMELHKKEEKICRKLGDKDSLQRSFGNQALILQTWGRLEEAMQLFKEQEHICQELGKRDDLQSSLGNQALILRTWGRLDEAMQLLKEQEHAYQELGDKDGLQRSLGNQALILQSWGKLDEAMAMHKGKEHICRELGNKDGIQTALGNQALILKAKGKLDEALRLFKAQEQMCRELGNRMAIQKSLGNQGLILNVLGRSDEAMEMQKEKERICRELGDLDGIQTALGNQAVILQAWRKYDEAMRLSKEKEEICLQIKNIEGLCTAWVYQGSIHLMTGHKEMGLSLLRKAYEQAHQARYSAMTAKIKVMLDKFS